jgi:RNA ligase
MTATLEDLFDGDEFRKMLIEGYVSVQSHPTLPLFIYNYSPSAQYERMWNDVTTQCRGLIVDEDGYIVARPFAKFFNYGEVDQYTDLPAGDPIVSEKMDGSLGIIYTYEGVSRVATRGSFASDQALWATEFLRTNFPDFAQPEGVTTLVEIIYSQNRIVVDYGDREGLVLLGAIDNATGADIPILDVCYWKGTKWWTGPVAEHYEYHSAEDAVALATGDEFEDAEGVVLCWPRPDGPSFRLKIKHPRYVELHRIVTGLSTRTIHEALATDTFDDLIANVPDEFHPWIRQVEGDLRLQFDAISQRAESELMHARYNAGPFRDRRELAEQVKKTTYPGLCFALEDGKDISQRIWTMIRPERTTAMILDGEG